MNVRGINICITAALVILGFLSSGCKKENGYKVDITFEGINAQNVRVIYFQDGGLKVQEEAIVDSRLKLAGELEGPTVFELYDNNHTLLGLFVADNNEDVKVTLKAGNPLWIEASGDPVSEALSSFVNANSKVLGNPKELNEAVRNYVVKHPSELTSAVLMKYYFDTDADPDDAVQLFGLLSGDAAASGITDDIRALLIARTETATGEPMPPLQLNDVNDSLVIYSAPKGRLSLYCFEDKVKVDTALLKELVPSDVRLVDIRMKQDTFGWRRNIVPNLPDSSIALHARNVLAEPTLRQAGVYAIPFYIAVDTAGLQLYRGRDLRLAAESLNTQ